MQSQLVAIGQKYFFRPERNAMANFALPDSRKIFVRILNVIFLVSTPPTPNRYALESEIQLFS